MCSMYRASERCTAARSPVSAGLRWLWAPSCLCCLWLPMDRLLAAYLSAALLMIVFGVWDDRVSLSPAAKFGGQLLSVLIIVLVGGVSIASVTLTERIALPSYIAMPLSILFLLGATNAINLSDGLDGLAGGTTLLACCALAALGLTLGVPFVVTVALVVVGSILGFLRFNTYPARIFMGDGGSQFLGFTVGVLAIVLTQTEGVPLSAALPILLLGLPILDTLTVMLLRMFRGQSPFKADRTHIHHKLLALGFDHHEAVIVIYFAQACLFLAAWFLRFESDLLILGVFGLFAAVFLGALLAAERTGWRVRARSKAHEPSGLARLRAWFGAHERAPRWALCVAALGAMVYALVLRYTPSHFRMTWVGSRSGSRWYCCLPRWRETQPHDSNGWRRRLCMSLSLWRCISTIAALHTFPAFHAVKWVCLHLCDPRGGRQDAIVQGTAFSGDHARCSAHNRGADRSKSSRPAQRGRFAWIRRGETRRPLLCSGNDFQPLDANAALHLDRCAGLLRRRGRSHLPERLIL